MISVNSQSKTLSPGSLVLWPVNNTLLRGIPWRTIVQNMKLWRWIGWCALAGLIVPAVLILRWKVLGSIFGRLELILWPSSIMLLGLEGPTPRSSIDIIGFYAIVIAMNMALYAVVGTVLWPLLRIALRRRSPGF